mmetsp:Transcript_59859/g.192700  ORF Transcript_59859/g.192700 Transcript_59859/m.192700 type:complete len:214 (-) Transcript_59859:1396-2037(-)
MRCGRRRPVVRRLQPDAGPPARHWHRQPQRVPMRHNPRHPREADRAHGADVAHCQRHGGARGDSPRGGHEERRRRDVPEPADRALGGHAARGRERARGAGARRGLRGRGPRARAAPRAHHLHGPADVGGRRGVPCLLGRAGRAGPGAAPRPGRAARHYTLERLKLLGRLAGAAARPPRGRLPERHERHERDERHERHGRHERHERYERLERHG